LSAVHAPSLRVLPWYLCALQLRKKYGKTSVRVKKTLSQVKKNLSHSTVYILPKNTHTLQSPHKHTRYLTLFKIKRTYIEICLQNIVLLSRILIKFFINFHLLSSMRKYISWRARHRSVVSSRPVKLFNYVVIYRLSKKIKILANNQINVWNISKQFVKIYHTRYTQYGRWLQFTFTIFSKGQNKREILLLLCHLFPDILEYPLQAFQSVYFLWCRISSVGSIGFLVQSINPESVSPTVTLFAAESCTPNRITDYHTTMTPVMWWRQKQKCTTL
jgi:hypothetical protein